MLSIYKKIEKSMDNPYGIVSIDDVHEIDRPFLLCLSAQDNYDKSVFGIIREGARALLVNTSQEFGAGYKIEDMPNYFLGVKFTKDEKFNENYEEIVDSFLYPFLVGKDNRDFNKVIRQARRINLMSYCDGTMTYKKIEKRLIDKLLSAGFIDSEVRDIVSQISLTAIGTMVDTSDLVCTSATFVDVNDMEIYNQMSDVYKNMLNENRRKCIYGPIAGSQSVLCVYDGSGNHSLKEYFVNGNVVKPAICGVISSFIENSIKNEYSDDLIKISSSGCLDILRVYADEKVDSKCLMDKLYSSVNYGDVSKYTLEEASIRRQLDLSYKELQKSRKMAELYENDAKRKDTAINSIVQNIKKYSSDVAFYQILVSAGVWQLPKNMGDIFDKESDREIRTKYEMLSNVQFKNR